MKIGFVLDDGLDSTDGVQQYILSLGSWLKARGHEVHYLVGETKRSDIKNLHSFSKNLSVRFNANRLRTPLPASKRRIEELLRRERFDILHVQVPYSPFMAARVIKAAPKRTKIIGTFHILPYGTLEKIGVHLLGFWLRSTVKKFDKMLSVSEPARELCFQAFKADSEVLPNVVDVSAMKSAKKPAKSLKRIVFLGRLVERKGCIKLIEAMKIIEERHRKSMAPKYELLIGGDGPDRQKIIAKIEQYGLKDKVRLEGFIDEKQKPEFLNSADMAVFPSLGGESFGIVLIEAMAARSGVVIAGDNPGYRSVLADTPECLVDARHPSKLADVIEKFLNDEDLASQTFQEQQIIVKRFDINAVGKKLEKIYSELAK